MENGHNTSIHYVFFWCCSRNEHNKTANGLSCSNKSNRQNLQLCLQKHTQLTMCPIHTHVHLFCFFSCHRIPHWTLIFSYLHFLECFNRNRNRNMYWYSEMSLNTWTNRIYIYTQKQWKRCECRSVWKIQNQFYSTRVRHCEMKVYMQWDDHSD